MKSSEIILNTLYEFSNDYNELTEFVLPYHREENSFKVLVFYVENNKWYRNNYNLSMFIGRFKQEVRLELFNKYKKTFFESIFENGLRGEL